MNISETIDSSRTYIPFIYYSFGMVMEGRSFSVQGKYRYGFNGKERDDEIAAESYDFGARIYDGRIGRWLSIDPIIKSMVSPYVAFLNSPITIVDPNGEDDYFDVNGNYLGSDERTSYVIRIMKTSTLPQNFYSDKVNKKINSVNASQYTMTINQMETHWNNSKRLFNIFRYYLELSGSKENSPPDNSFPDLVGINYKPFDNNVIMYVSTVYQKEKKINTLYIALNKGKVKESLTGKYEWLNTIYHERLHVQDNNNNKGNELLRHEEIYKLQMLHSTWQKCSKRYQEGVVGSLINKLEEIAKIGYYDEVQSFITKFNQSSNTTNYKLTLNRKSDGGGEVKITVTKERIKH